jgi:hypothetical protein
MKVLSFSFKFSPVGHGKTITNALLHHAFPRRHSLLFAYDYRYESVVDSNRIVFTLHRVMCAHFVGEMRLWALSVSRMNKLFS